MGKEFKIDPEIKKEINEGGFEIGEEGEGGAAVLIGKKEEMPNLEARLENEGRAANLESYLRIHKEVIIPKDFIDKEIERVKPIEPTKKGSFFLDERSLGSKMLDLYYIDSAGDLAKVKIDLKKIDTTKKDLENKTELRKIALKAQEKLKDLGFETGLLFSQSRNQGNEIDIIIERYKQQLKSANLENAKEKFNF